MRNAPPFQLSKPRFISSGQFGDLLRRGVHCNARPRLSQYCVRIAGIEAKTGEDGKENSTALLSRAGYLRQSQPGIFHFLPLGLRVQSKIERLIDKHMQSIGAAKLSLSSLSSEKLWRQSGRLASGQGDTPPKQNGEFFQLKDRRGSQMLLSPTHEEEITALVGSVVQSYKDLPLRLFQVSRKYRDELRPRGGLLRGREFLMKDLYTFDMDQESARRTYDEVRKAYSAFFEDLKLPVLVAEADSGNMGGNVSHEYHLPNPNGEDKLIHCPSCSFTYNEEFVPKHVDYRREKLAEAIPKLAQANLKQPSYGTNGPDVTRWDGVTDDGLGLITVFCLSDRDSVGSARAINPYSVKAAFPPVNLGIEKPRERFEKRGNAMSTQKNTQTRYFLFDSRIGDTDRSTLLANEVESTSKLVNTFMLLTSGQGQQPANLQSPRNGDQCSSCGAAGIEVLKAIELGHTFQLGTRYTKDLNLSVVGPSKVVTEEGSLREKRIEPKLWPEMGCHGIGISRMIAAIAGNLSDPQGLNWPRTIAPFDFVLISTKELKDHAWKVFDQLLEHLSDDRRLHDTPEGVFDDRDTSVRTRIDEAMIMGFPIVVVMGKPWQEQEKLEIICRRLGIRKDVSLGVLGLEIEKVLEQL